MATSDHIGSRLVAERERLGLTQEQMADIAGVSKRSQGGYERGERPIDSDYLVALARMGADVQYVLTGVLSPNIGRVAEELGTYKTKKHGSAPQRKEVEQQVLAGVLAGVDEYLAEHKLKMPADKKAELVMLLCDFFNAETAKDTPAVKEAVGKIIQLRSGRR